MKFATRFVSMLSVAFGLTVITSTVNSSRALAWGDRGHEVIGEVAERYLTPAAKQGILDILGPESLAMTATWPDSLRDLKAFDSFKDYHIVNIPTGMTYDSMPASQHEERNAVTVLEKFPSLIKNPKTPRSVKMMALRYIVHVVGDVHQPLHVGNGVDFGGNVCYVYWDANDTKVRSDGKAGTPLHKIWDGMLIDYGTKSNLAKHSGAKFYNYLLFADDLIADVGTSPVDIKKLQKSTYADWLKESQGLRSSVYPDEKPVRDEDRNYCSGGHDHPEKKADPANYPKLYEGAFADYKDKSYAIIETQLFNAGVRLAGLLNDIFASPIDPGPNTSLPFDKVIEQVLLKN